MALTSAHCKKNAIISGIKRPAKNQSGGEHTSPMHQTNIQPTNWMCQWQSIVNTVCSLCSLVLIVFTFSMALYSIHQIREWAGLVREWANPKINGQKLVCTVRCLQDWVEETRGCKIRDREMRSLRDRKDRPGGRSRAEWYMRRQFVERAHNHCCVEKSGSGSPGIG